jgi:putative phage-type endonuclease
VTTTREQWLAERRLGLGGSDAAAVLGLSPWKTNVELWEEKTGRREDKDISDDPYVQYGVAAEPIIRAQFAIDYPQYDIEHQENISVASSEYQQLRASLDGKLIERETGRIGVLEIKAAIINSRADRDKWNGAIPQHYYTQILHNMIVTGADFAVLKARLVSNWNEDLWVTERSYHFERADCEADIAYLIEKELAFWRLVETDTRPNLILPQI